MTILIDIDWYQRDVSWVFGDSAYITDQFDRWQAKKKENNKYEMLQNFSLVATALRNTFLALPRLRAMIVLLDASAAYSTRKYV